MLKKINAVLIRVPLRISFIGGGSDLPEYIKKSNHGCVISSTIKKYTYIFLKRHGSEFNEKFKIHYTNHIENTNSINQIKNNIIKQTLKYLKYKESIQIIISNDVKPGSGLGSSSGLIAGLIKGIYAIQNKKITKKKLFKLATKIELEILKSPIGYQDHAATIYGGLNYFKFTKKNLIIKKIKNFRTISSLFKYTYIVWTGKYRKANIILKDVNKNLQINYQFIDKIKNLTEDYFKKINKISYKDFANMLKISWDTKKKFSKKISNNSTTKMINKIIKAGGLGAKLNGAGQEGYITFVSKNHALKKIKKTLNSDYISKVEFENNGIEILYKC